VATHFEARARGTSLLPVNPPEARHNHGGQWSVRAGRPVDLSTCRP